jgi:ketosteroid isomerase-like protein
VNTSPMPSANLDLVRSILAASERGDLSSTAWAHPEIEFVIADGPAPGSWKGVAGLVEGMRSIVSAWEKYSVEVEEYRELDDEHVLVLIRRRGRGKKSGIELGQMRSRGAGLYHIRDGKVTRAVFYFERERALADLGLSEQTGSRRS